MRNFRHKGSAALYAWVISIGIHAAILVFFASVKFSSVQPAYSQAPGPQVQIARMIHIPQAEAIIPKPKVKKPARLPVTGYQSPITAHLLPAANAVRTGTGDLRDLIRNDVSAGARLPASSAILPGNTSFSAISTCDRRICYVVDCSGSMQGVFSLVLARLKESISKLEPDQYFYIIFFGGEKLYELGNGQLIRADKQAKSTAMDFTAAIRPAGKTNTLAALKRAMQICDAAGNKAGIIYLLTDGFELSSEDARNPAERAEQLRKRFAPQTKINTIGFWAQPRDCEVLKTISSRSGGKFVFISGEDR